MVVLMRWDKGGSSLTLCKARRVAQDLFYASALKCIGGRHFGRAVATARALAGALDLTVTCHLNAHPPRENMSPATFRGSNIVKPSNDDDDELASSASSAH